MNEYVLARSLHVLAVVLWIGGVAFVSTVLLPTVVRAQAPAERLALFDRIERRFAWQARLTTLLAGATGFWMTHRYGLWARFADPAFWWMHLMVAVWAIFTLMLFVLEPLVLHRVLERRHARDPEGTFALVQRLHWILLALSLAAVIGAVLGAHGVARPRELTRPALEPRQAACYGCDARRWVSCPCTSSCHTPPRTARAPRRSRSR